MWRISDRVSLKLFAAKADRPQWVTAPGTLVIVIAEGPRSSISRGFFGLLPISMRPRIAVTAAVLAALASGCSSASKGVGATHSPSVTPSPSPSLPAPSPSATASNRPTTLADALRTQLEANLAVRKRLVGYERPDGAVLCSTHVFGSDPSHAHLYVWVSCSTYTTGPSARNTSGGGDPALLSVKGSGADTEILAVRFPRIAHLNEDTAAMFPAPIVTLMARREFETVPSESQLLAEARGLGTN